MVEGDRLRDDCSRGEAWALPFPFPLSVEGIASEDIDVFEVEVDGPFDFGGLPSGRACAGKDISDEMSCSFSFSFCLPFPFSLLPLPCPNEDVDIEGPADLEGVAL